MTSRYRITKKTDGPTGIVTFTPEYYGYKHIWPFRRWWDFSWTFSGMYGPAHHPENFKTHEEAVEYLRKHEADITASKIPSTTVSMPVDLDAKPKPALLTRDEMEALCVFNTPAERDAAKRYADYAWSKGWLLPVPICRNSDAWKPT